MAQGYQAGCPAVVTQACALYMLEHEVLWACQSCSYSLAVQIQKNTNIPTSSMLMAGTRGTMHVYRVTGKVG